MSNPRPSEQSTGRGRWFNVGVYLLVCLGLLVFASLVWDGSAGDAGRVALAGAAVMFGFALFSAWRR